MKLIVGLGNPGTSYRFTRHNAGALVIEKLAREYKLKFQNNRSFNSLIATGRIEDVEVCLVLPQTFMNLSGQAVAALVQKKAIAIDDILIVCDDVALSPGIIRIKPEGSDGGHNGLFSIIERLVTKKFARLRIGVGRCAEGCDLAEYVLDRFGKDEMAILETTLDKVIKATILWISEGIDKTMNHYNKLK